MKWSSAHYMTSIYNYLRAAVGTGETYRGKGRKFDFFHILTLDKVGYN